MPVCAASTFKVFVDKLIPVPAVKAVLDTAIAAPDATLAFTTASDANLSAVTASSANSAVTTPPSLIVTAPLDTAKLSELNEATPLLEVVASSPAIVTVLDVAEVSIPEPPAIVRVSLSKSIAIVPLSLVTSKSSAVTFASTYVLIALADAKVSSLPDTELISVSIDAIPSSTFNSAAVEVTFVPPISKVVTEISPATVTIPSANVIRSVSSVACPIVVPLIIILSTVKVVSVPNEVMFD